MAVTKTNNLRQGSKGTDVSEVQKLLNQNGYSLDVDGSYGPKTAAAVKDYQKKNGLAVDGIVGTNTYGALTSNASKTTTGTKTSTGTNKTNKTNAGSNKTNAGSNKANTGTEQDTFTTPAGNTYEEFTYDDFAYDPFKGSDTLNQAWATLGQLQGNAPGSWADPYAEKRKGYLDEYENRDPFNYDFNSDALYQQYKDQYIQQGQMAMMDTMGQAAAMTGGYGNSYAQSVGQQAYNQQLNQLNAIMPEMYDRAFGIYQQKGQDLLNMYDLYTGLSNESYNKYLGDVDRFYNELNAATNYAQNLYNKEYGEWSDKTKMDFDTWSANTGLDFDEWAARTGILSDENNTLMNQNFQAGEAEKDRNFTASENEKNRDHETSERLAGQTFTEKQNKLAREADLEAAALKAAEKSPLDTESTLTWIKKFEGVKDLKDLERLASQFEDVVGPEVAGKWFDLYSVNFEDPAKGDVISQKVTGGSGGGSGTSYYQAW